MKPGRRRQGRNEGRVGKNGHALRVIFKLIILAQIDDTVGRELLGAVNNEPGSITNRACRRGRTSIKLIGVLEDLNETTTPSPQPHPDREENLPRVFRLRCRVIKLGLVSFNNNTTLFSLEDYDCNSPREEEGLPTLFLCQCQRPLFL